MSQCWFITGTDTGVGKTLVSCALLNSFSIKKDKTAGYKPVASGGKMTVDGIRNEDALALQYHSTVPLSYQQVNPVSFIEETAPHIASKKVNQPIDISILSNTLSSIKNRANLVIVEGAGGWYTPLSDQYTFADWVHLERLPVILVVGMKLGCLNHALLTQESLKMNKLHLVGWIANYIEPVKNDDDDYLLSLKNRLAAPMIGVIPYSSKPSPIDAANYLNTDYLIENH